MPGRARRNSQPVTPWALWGRQNSSLLTAIARKADGLPQAFSLPGASFQPLPVRHVCNELVPWALPLPAFSLQAEPLPPLQWRSACLGLDGQRTACGGPCLASDLALPCAQGLPTVLPRAGW